MDSFLGSTDCMSHLKDTVSASQLSAVMHMCVATAGAAAQADASPLKPLSRKQLHDSPGALSRSTSASATASTTVQDDQQSFKWAKIPAAAAPGSSTLSPLGTDDACRQKHDQQHSTAQQMTNGEAEDTSSFEICDLLTNAAPSAACKAMPAANSSSSSTASSRSLPPPALILPELQEQQHHEYSQHHQQHWIPKAMPAQPSPAAAAAGRMLMQPCMAAAAASLSGTLSPPAKVVGVRAAATLLGSGNCTPECLAPVTNHAATINDHAAALEAALLASRLH